MPCIDYLTGRERFREPRSAGAVPAFGKWDQGPGEFVVVRGFRWRAERRQTGQKVFLRRGLDRHSHGLQQSVELNFAHRALLIRERRVSKVFCLQIEQIAQTVSIRPTAADVVTDVLSPTLKVDRFGCTRV